MRHSALENNGLSKPRVTDKVPTSSKVSPKRLHSPSVHDGAKQAGSAHTHSGVKKGRNTHHRPGRPLDKNIGHPPALVPPMPTQGHVHHPQAVVHPPFVKAQMILVRGLDIRGALLSKRLGGDSMHAASRSTAGARGFGMSTWKKIFTDAAKVTRRTGRRARSPRKAAPSLLRPRICRGKAANDRRCVRFPL